MGLITWAKANREMPTTARKPTLAPSSPQSSQPAHRASVTPAPQDNPPATSPVLRTSMPPPPTPIPERAFCIQAFAGEPENSTQR